MSEIVVEGLEAARLLVPDPRVGEVVLHFVTVTGEHYHFGVSLRDAVNLLVRWQQDVTQIALALAEGTAINGDVEVLSKPTVN